MSAVRTDKKRPADRQTTAREKATGRHAAPSNATEKHLGALESQVGRTLPPKGDDDEPKQG